MNQDLVFKLAAKTQGEQVLDSFDRRLKNIERSTLNMSRGFSRAGALIKTFIGAAVVREGIQYAKGIIDIADNLGELSQKTGITANALSGYQEAAKQAGLSQDGLEISLRKYSQALSAARAGNVQMVSAFRNLGISADDLRKRSPEQIMERLANNFAKLEDGPNKAANALKIFGRAGTDMIPFLNQGAEALNEFALGLSGDFVARSDQFNDTVSAMGSALKKTFAQGFDTLLPTLQDILNAFRKFPSLGIDVKSVMESLGEIFRLGSLAAGSAAAAVIDFGDDLIKFGKQVVALAKLDFDKIKQLQSDYEKRSAARIKADEDRVKALLKNSRLLGQGTLEEIRAREALETAATGKKKKSGPVQSEGLEDGAANRIREFLQLKELENKQLEEALDDYKLTAIELSKVRAARKLDEEVLKTSKGLTKEQSEALRVQTEEIKKNRLELIEHQAQQERTFGYGARVTFQEYVDTATNAAKNAERVFTKAFQGMEDSLVEFCKTGELNFKKFADAVIDEILRIVIRQQVIAPIVGAIGGALFGGATGTGTGSAGGSYGGDVSYAANGGIMTSKGMAKLNRYARGGIANSPQLAVFGEGSRPEAYVPLPDGKRIPVNMKGAGGGCAVTVNVNMGSGETTSESNSETGKQLGLMISNAVKTELIRQKRPGGLLAG